MIRQRLPVIVINPFDVRAPFATVIAAYGRDGPGQNALLSALDG